MAVLSRTFRLSPRQAAGLYALTLALLGPAMGARAQESLEVAVKAAYLYKFAPFVSWPATAFDSPSSPFSICIAGADPFGAVLDRAVTDQHVDGRAIVIHRMAKADRKTPCHILYIGGPASAAREALRTIAGAPVLTVTDGPAAPAIIGFVLDQGRVRFWVNDQAAADNGLAISSKLLSLAVSVTPRKSAGVTP